MKDEKNLGFHRIQVLVLSVEKNDVRMNVVFHPYAFILCTYLARAIKK